MWNVPGRSKLNQKFVWEVPEIWLFKVRVKFENLCWDMFSFIFFSLGIIIGNSEKTNCMKICGGWVCVSVGQHENEQGLHKYPGTSLEWVFLLILLLVSYGDHIWWSSGLLLCAQLSLLEVVKGPYTITGDQKQLRQGRYLRPGMLTVSPKLRVKVLERSILITREWIITRLRYDE